MKLTRRLVPVLLIAAFLTTSCGGDDPLEPDDGITISDIVGSWTATSDIHTNNANPAQVFDMIAAGGAVRFTMLDGGATRSWFDFGTFHDEWDAAVTLSGSTITTDPVEAGWPTTVWTFTLVGGVLTLTRADAEWDFTLTGAPPVSTTEVIVFTRN